MPIAMTAVTAAFPVRRSSRRLGISLLAGLALAVSAAGTVQAQAAPAPAVPVLRDGQHDFDFNIGVWKTHIRRRAHPLTGSREMIELNGTVTVRKVWGGKAEIEEIEADGPDGHWEGMSLFLYDSQTRQWSQAFFNSGAIDLKDPALVGSFANGRGELYAADTYKGRAILVRGVWSDITPDAHHYEESYSADGGRTWEAIFTTELTRAPS